MHDIGNRMKSYEDDRRMEGNVIGVRVDGHNFHRWTKEIKAEKPFDKVVQECMRFATANVADSIPNFNIAYTQSDEATFFMSYLGENAQPWFGNKPQKIASIVASRFTLAFAHEYDFYVDFRGYPNIPAVFDARCFSMPLVDAPNNLVWRQLDWRRNSIQMVGQHYLGHAKMQGKNSKQVVAELRTVGVDYDNLDKVSKYGTFIIGQGCMGVALNEQLDYADIVKYAGWKDYINLDPANFE